MKRQITTKRRVNTRQQILLPPTMSETIRLFCWVLNTPIDQIFPVDVGRDEIWGSVKDAIKEKKKPDFNDIAADTLHLRKVRHCAISHVVMLNSNLKGHHRSFPTFPLGIRRFLEESYGHKPTRSHRIFVKGPQGPTSRRSY